MSQTAKQSSEKSNQIGSSTVDSESFVKGLWGVRYQVKDVKRSVDFYTQQIGLKLDQQHLPAFAQVSVGHLKLVLSGPGASGSRAMPDGRQQAPGGWNRIMLELDDLPARIEMLKKAGIKFRMKWKWARAGSKSSWKIPMGIRLNYLSRRINSAFKCL